MINLNLDEKYRSGDEDGGQNNWCPLVDEKCVAKKRRGSRLNNRWCPLTPWDAPETSKASTFSQPKMIRVFEGNAYLKYCHSFNNVDILTQCSLTPAFTPRTNLSSEGSTVQEAEVRWEATYVAYMVMSVCLDLRIVCYLSAERCNKNGVRKDRRTTW